VSFETDVTILKERQWVPYARQHPHCYDSEALPSESWYEGDQQFSVSYTVYSGLTQLSY